MLRRNFLSAAAWGQQSTRRYRTCLIGHTGRGDYGHDWDTAFRGFGNIDLLAVADPVESGRAKAKFRSGAQRGYADYRQMLDKERPEIVGICTRWPDQRLPMLRACAERGAHVLVEKPLAATLDDADAIVRIAAEHRIRVQVGHTTRTSALVRRMVSMVNSGEIGELLEMRTRSKEDHRAGGEEMIVLGSHIFDLMRMFANDPLWVMAHVTRDGREIGSGDFRQGSEPVGPIAGNQIAAMFSFREGLHGYYASKASKQTNGPRFGFTLCGAKGMIFLPLSFSNPSLRPAILRSDSWITGPGLGQWQPLEPSIESREEANASMVADLLDSIETNRDPACSARDGLWTLEMVTSVYQSHLQGRPVEFPLRDRHSPALAAPAP